MPDSEQQDFQPAEFSDTLFQKIISLSAKNRYSGNVLMEIVKTHQELHDYVEELVDKAMEDRKNDDCNSKFEKSMLPQYPEHVTLADFDESCIKEDEKEAYQSLISLEFLKGNKPNIILVGPPNFGKETIAMYVGETLCLGNISVRYIEYHDFINVLEKHHSEKAENKIYDTLLKTDLLWVDNFGGKMVYDDETADEMYQLFSNRLSSMKKNPKAESKTKATMITTDYVLDDWTTRFECEYMIVFRIVNCLYGSGNLIHVDKTEAKPAENSDKG